MARPKTPLILDPRQRSALQQFVNADSTPQGLAFRAQLILDAAEGKDNATIARRRHTSHVTVGLWRRRFLKEGIGGLADRKRSGRPVRLPAGALDTVLTAVVQPPPGRARWSVRSMARHAGVSKSRVQEIWSRNDLKPHRTRAFKLSKDPHFEAKFWDVIGLYLDPPQKALVLCCDEKSQCQALERTQPGLPLGVGHVRTRTHDYTRHGTVTLFAALNYLDGKILSQTAPRHTHREWLGFLKKLDAQTPAALTVHLIIDNYATHKHPKVRAWLEKHPRFVLHFTPTSSSWLNLIERFFRDLTVDVVREGSFTSVPALVEAIETYLAQRNLAPKAYRWTARGEDILAKIARARKRLSEVTTDTSRTAH
jgi:transposase